MSPINTENQRNVQDGGEGGGPSPKPKERDRLRDIIVVFVTYPITPTKETSRLAEKKPWLEFLSLLLKVGLAAYAIWEAVSGET